jgi:hypothetical protein
MPWCRDRRWSSPVAKAVFRRTAGAEETPGIEQAGLQVDERARRRARRHRGTRGARAGAQRRAGLGYDS